MSVKLKLGDCLDILKTMPDNYIDLVVTSPPYDNLRSYNGYVFNFEGIAQELTRVLKQGGVIVWVVNDATVKGSETGTSFRQALYFISIGLNLHDTMIYQKLNPMPLNHNRYEQAFEYMFVLSKGKPKTFNGLREPCLGAGKRISSLTHRKDGNNLVTGAGIGKEVKQNKLLKNIWVINNSHPENHNGHPAPFPLVLAKDHVQSWSNPGDVVLDPFLGSGTTGVAAVQLGRKFIGIEISQEYLEIAKKRIDEESNEQTK